jgi:L-ascorbate metabolism protein UlaG (beta-lactamase superfamily)
MTSLSRWLRVAAIAVVTVALVAAAAIAWEWQDRPAVSELGWPVATPAEDTAGQVTVTWLGITTLLFDDGTTQILTDGTFTRLGAFDIASQRRIYSDVAAINHGLADFRVNRLAAVIPLHAHFDHAMDSGLVANRTSAIVLGSESAANVARGAEVPVSQYQILADGESRQFGDFTITLLESAHAPIGMLDEPWFAGAITEPLEQPASVSSWKAGVCWTVIIAHPQVTALVQGSAGFVGGKLEGVNADVALLSVAGLAGAGRPYTERYWAETVARTGAARVFPLHFDDYTQPFGEIALLPEMLDDVPAAARWMNELAAGSEAPITIQRLPLGRPVPLRELPAADR